MSAGAGAPAARIPVSTYRLQLHAGFTFADAARVVPYLDRLGITDLYVSPILQFHPGSTHGYDVTDHGCLSDDLGGDTGFATLRAARVACDMGLVVDFVPNHMGIGDARANRWWWDVIENGPCSPYARFFDIDWAPVKDELAGKVLLPVLGDQYGRVLERGELALALADGALVLRYFDHVYPINPRRVPHVLRHGIDELERRLGSDDHDLRELLSILTALDNLPAIVETAPGRVVERQREKEVARERLAALLARSVPMRAHVEACVAAVNGRVGEPASFNVLHELLELQAYRLAAWRTAFHEINYRRFFDVNALASIRMEEPEVFAAAHHRLLELVAAGDVTGLRLDHLDGLADPAGYLRALERAVREARNEEIVAARPSLAPPLPLWVVAEKILSTGEELPSTWRLHGTSGYEFLNDVNGLFVDPSGARPLQRWYDRFTGAHARLDDVVYESKKTVMESTLASELNVLAHTLNRISEADRRSRDFTLNSLREMLLEVVACLPAYRTYVTERGHDENDARALDAAIAGARRRNPTMDRSMLAFFRAAVLGATSDAPARAARREFVVKLQQYTPPVQAKGLEDTAFYRHVPLLALNEVGGTPECFGRSVDDFQERLRARAARWPRAMVCTSTHDTKRGEDARARLNVLSEMPDAWARTVARWARVNAANRRVVEGEPAPDRIDELIFYQTLLGAWPPGATVPGTLVVRLRDYMVKAIREAKRHTSWIHPAPAYEEAVAAFVEETLTGPRAARFLDHFLPFATRVAELGMVNGLAQLVLKLVAPGVPDFYQGSELWDLSLVDPDNRRPVDFATRAAMLESLGPLFASDVASTRAARLRALVASWHDGVVKLYVTACGLHVRRALPAVFLEGDCVPVGATGTFARHVVAVARARGDEAVLAVVPRLVARLAREGMPIGASVWADTTLVLPPGLARHAWVDVLGGTRIGAGAEVPIGRLFDAAPLALLRASPAE